MRIKLALFSILLVNLTLGAHLVNSNQRLYNEKESQNLGFEVSQNSILNNPPAKKARIYVMRKKEYVGANVTYELYYQYNPKISPNIKGQNEAFIDKNIYKYNIFGKLANKSKFFMDFEVGKPLLLLSKLETHSYVVFTPQAGRIYCVQGSIILGLNNARPNLEFISKDQCERLYKEIK